VASQNFHLTLVFLGYVDQEKLSDIAGAIRSAIAGIKPFDIEFEGVGGLPRLERPRVIYVDVKDESGGLTKLNEKISEAMKPFDVKLEDRKYIPHMTLGRVATPKNLNALVEASKKFAGRSFGLLHVSSVELMLSDLRPSGPVYTVAATIELK
jgi:2'-5' RNA ligase